MQNHMKCKPNNVCPSTFLYADYIYHRRPVLLVHPPPLNIYHTKHAVQGTTQTRAGAGTLKHYFGHSLVNINTSIGIRTLLHWCKYIDHFRPDNQSIQSNLSERSPLLSSQPVLSSHS